MLEKETLQVLQHAGAIRTGHFVYTSGEHGDSYVDKDKLSLDPIALSMLAAAIACEVRKSTPDAVVAPALGAIAVGQWIAYHLSALMGRTVRSIIAEKTGDGFSLRPKDPALVEGRKILVVEDILTTGGSARKVIEAVRSRNGEVIGLACLCNRGGVTAEKLGAIPFLFSLITLDLQRWEASRCPLCEKGVAISTEAGKGVAFLKKQRPS